MRSLASGLVICFPTPISVGQFAGHISDPLQIRRFQERVAQELRLDVSMMETVSGYGEENIAFPRTLDEFIEMLKAADISARLNDVRSETLRHCW